MDLTAAAAPTKITRIRTLRSCSQCRARKVKCDRGKPCGACQKNQLLCVFPEQTPRPPRPRVPDRILLDRISRLEQVIGSLCAERSQDKEHKDSNGGRRGSEEESPADDSGSGSGTSPESTVSLEEVENPLSHGRLIKNAEGKARFIGSSYWASLSDEVQAVKELFTFESAEDAHLSSPFFHSVSRDLSHFHPPSDEGWYLYHNYTVAVDPVARIIHKGAFEREYGQFLQARADGVRVTGEDGFEALVFAVYYASVISMHPDAIVARYGVEKQALASQYRFALEHAISNANFLHCADLPTLQALMLLVFVLRNKGETSYSWSLVGLVIRIAQSLGLHRDSSHFGIKPLEAEVRRRLWYELCILDVRIAEDHGAESTISALSYDTRKPLNVNDADLTEDMEEPPEPRQGFTEMTFHLLRFAFLDCLRALADPRGTAWGKMSLQEKDVLLEKLSVQISKEFLEDLDPSQPMQAMLSMAAKLMLAKARMILYHPYVHSWNGQTISDAKKAKLFEEGIELIEGTIQLAKHSASQQWHWFFQGFHQAHAIALILYELSVNPLSPLADRAWAAVDTFMETPDLFGTGSPEHAKRISRPLGKLKERAWRQRVLNRVPVVAERGLQGDEGEGEDAVMEPVFDPLNDSPIEWGDWQDMFTYITV